MTDLLAAMMDTSHVDRWIYNIWRQAEQGIHNRDIEAVLEALGMERRHCFVWPDTYSKTYHYQRVCERKVRIFGLEDELCDLPVVMRSAISSLHYRYGKAGWCCRVRDRYLRRFRPTMISGTWAYGIALSNRLERKHNLPDILRLLEPFRRAVLVDGRPIPIDSDKQRALEKGIEIINKIDRLAA